jgi:hypothetical protein
MQRLMGALTLILLAACSSSQSAEPGSEAGAGGQAGTAAGGSGGTSAGTGGELVSGGAAGDSDGSCLGDLTQLSQDCVSSFDGTPAELPPCNALLPVANSYWIYDCVDTLSYELGSGFSGLVCSYDPATHKLVGVLEEADTTVYCNGKSFTIQAGKVPKPSCQGTTTNETACGAAGAAGATAETVQ